MRATHTVLVPALAALGLLGTGCSRDQSREMAHKDTYIAELEAQVAGLKDRLAEAEANQGSQALPPPSDSTAPVPAADPTADIARDLEGSGAEVSMRSGDVVISLANDILFAAGEALITDRARSSLAQVAEVIEQRYGDNRVRVEGHTDNQPLVRTKEKWGDNWNLSAARAYAVLQELIRLGIDEDRLAFAGYGEFAPRESNASKQGKARNRRVEIVVIER